MKSKTLYTIILILFCFISLPSLGQKENPKEVKYYKNTIIPVCEEGLTIELTLQLDSYLDSQYKNVLFELSQYDDGYRIIKMNSIDSTRSISLIYSYDMSLEDIRTALEKNNITVLKP